MTAYLLGSERRYRRLVERHFSGRASPRGERRMRSHLVSCAQCRAYYDRYLLLARVDPATARPMRHRLARGLGLSQAPSEPPVPAARRWQVLAVTALAATCALALVVRQHQRAEFEPRGAATGSQLLVYELMPGKTPHPVVSRIHAGAALAFAYANVGRKRRLMVLAVDENRRVYWYHPAWKRQSEDPTGLEIADDDSLHEIPQAITHHFSGRRVQLFGVFLDRALSVRNVEDLVVHAPSDGPIEQRRLLLRIADAEVTRLDLEVMAAP